MPTKPKTRSMPEGQLDHHAIDQFKDVPIRSSIAENNKIMEELFKDSSDIVLRQFDIENGPKAMLCYVDGMVTTSAVDAALQALMIFEGDAFTIDRITEQTLPVTQASKIQFFKELLTNLLSGDSVLFVDGQDNAVCLGSRGGIRRSVAEPETETVVRGPREGFNEHLRTNTSLVRSKIKSPRLKMKSFVIGTETNTNVILAYMAGIVNPKLVEEAEHRLSRIKIDGVLESGYIEEFIQDQGYSPFPQVQTTERPDTVRGGAIRGRVAIMVDGTPFALIAPFGFWRWAQASEDYYERFMVSTLLRWLRMASLL